MIWAQKYIFAAFYFRGFRKENQHSLAYTPKTKWFESFSLADFVAPPNTRGAAKLRLRLCLPARIARWQLVDKHMDFALTFPNHFASGISTKASYILSFSSHIGPF